MSNHHTLHIRCFNGHGVLPRVLLAFSRRRIRIQALQFFDVFENGQAELQIDIDIDAKTVADLVRQLDRVVEVQSVKAESRQLRPEDAESEGAQVAA
ncbi:MAG TPA: ACT domain-containing protein [Gammaproteobacteria bacterium]